MKYLFLIFLFSTSAFAADSATVEIEYKNSTRKNQIIILEKDKSEITCKVRNETKKKVSISRLKDLQFPLPDMKSVELCNKVVYWTYKNKSSKSCYEEQDFVISDIILACYN